jgi:hypothetical protein
MSYLNEKIEIITDGGRRRRWPAAKKLRIVEESFGLVPVKWRLPSVKV